MAGWHSAQWGVKTSVRSWARVGRAATSREEALALLREAALLDPQDRALAAQLARRYVERGDAAAAAEFATVDTVGDDPDLLLAVAEAQARDGRLADAMPLLREALAAGPEHRQRAAAIGWALAGDAPDAAYEIVRLAADAAAAEPDWASAAAFLQEFVSRVP
jgi:Flp pilus assembly protein TadD